MKLYFQDKTLCLSVYQDLTLYEGDKLIIQKFSLRAKILFNLKRKIPK